MSMGRRATKKSDEFDVVTAWRKYICYMQRAGVTNKIKTRMRRRERRQAKGDLRRDFD